MYFSIIIFFFFSFLNLALHIEFLRIMFLNKSIFFIFQMTFIVGLQALTGATTDNAHVAIHSIDTSFYFPLFKSDKIKFSLTKTFSPLFFVLLDAWL